MEKYYLIVLKSDSQSIYDYDSIEKARAAYHSELASDYTYFEQGIISYFTVMITNLSGDVLYKEFMFNQEKG